MTIPVAYSGTVDWPLANPSKKGQRLKGRQKKKAAHCKPDLLKVLICHNLDYKPEL